MAGMMAWAECTFGEGKRGEGRNGGYIRMRVAIENAIRGNRGNSIRGMHFMLICFSALL